MSDYRVHDLMRGVQALQDRHGNFTLELPYSVVVTLVAQLQLSLRHPRNAGETAQITRRVVDGIISAIGQSEPRVAELLRLGDDPSQDVCPKCGGSGGGDTAATCCPLCHGEGR